MQKVPRSTRLRSRSARSAAVVATALALTAGVGSTPAWAVTSPVTADRTAVTPAAGTPKSLATKAIWADYSGDLVAKTTAMAQLAAVDPGMAQATTNVLGAIGAAQAAFPNPLPALAAGNTAIVVLGYGLLDNGAMRPELVNRLSAAWREAIIAPASPIIVTGGNPHHGVTEAHAMATWLIGHGIPAGRVHEENRAGSTVQNALYSTQLRRSIGAANAVLVTSPNHIRRAAADFMVAGTPIVGLTTSTEQWLSELAPPDAGERKGIYQDAIATFFAGM